MASGMIKIIKQAAMDAVENGNPCDLRFGTVVSTSPLKVRITSDFTIPESLLVVPNHLTNYSITANLGMGTTGGGGSTSNLSFTVVDERLVISSSVVTVDEGEDVTDDLVAEPVDERMLTMFNALEEGDKVVLIRNQGGKLYYILDRI